MSELDYSIYNDEMINGKVYLMAPSGTPEHSKAIGNIFGIFFNYFKSKECDVHPGSLDIYFDEKNYVIPDITVICDKSKYTEIGYAGIPTLIIEVLSPATQRRDRTDKFKLYENFNVPEYWLVSFKEKTIEQYILVNGKYESPNIWSLLNDYEFKKLSLEEQKTYTTKFKTSISEDLEIDLYEVFE